MSVWKRQISPSKPWGQRMLWCALLCTTSWVVGDAAGAAEPQGDAAAVDSGQGRLEEVVVTAQKREERLQDVPISISVLGGQDLDRSSLTSVTDTLNTISGVVASVAVQGGGTQIAMRGVGASGPLFNGSSPTGYYLDAVPFGLIQSAVAPDANPFDLQRVEVLRGPQGTLYGAGGEGGVVRILTADPDLNAFELKARTTLSGTDGGGPNYGADVAVNIPIVAGKLAARAVVGYEDMSGWVDSPTIKDINDSQSRNFRLKVSAQPTDQLSIGLSAWSTRDHSGAPPAADDNGRSTALIREPVRTDYDAGSIKIGYDFSALTLSSVSSYFHYTDTYEQDLGRFALPGYVVDLDLNSRIFAEELLLSSKGNGDWKWTAGAFYRHARDRFFQIIPPGAFLYTDEGDGSESAAVFGELSHFFANRELEWTLGARYFHDHVYTRENSTYPPAAPGTALYDVPDTFHALTPRAVLTWYPSRTLTAYASYSEGFRSGFPQTAKIEKVVPLPAVKPDKLRNYEIGAKSDWLDHRVSLDTALYYIDWRDVQQTLGVLFDVGGLSTCCIDAPVNGAAARGPGVDLALTTRPADGLQLGATFSWNDLKLTQAVYNGGVVVFAKGDRLNYSSKVTAGLFGDYSFPLAAKGLVGRLSASGNYSSKQTNRLLNNNPPTLLIGADPIFVRASFSVESSSLWRAMLFVDNLTNQHGSIPGTSPPPDLTPRLRPRTIGLELNFAMK